MKKSLMLFLSLMCVTVCATASGVTVEPMLVKGVLRTYASISLRPETYWHHGYERMAYGDNEEFSLLLTPIPVAKTVIEVTHSNSYTTECRFILDYAKGFQITADNSISDASLRCRVNNPSSTNGFELLVDGR